MQEPEFYHRLGVFYVALMIIFVVLFLTIPLIITVEVANKKGRSGFLWFLFSLIVSPLISLYLLHILGETDEKRSKRIIDEEKLRNTVRIFPTLDSENNFDKWKLKNPNKSVNDYYLSNEFHLKS